MRWIEWFVLAVSILGTLNLIMLRIASRRDKEAWDRRMEEIEKKHTAALCEFGARRARWKMRVRHLKKLLRQMSE